MILFKTFLCLYFWNYPLDLYGYLINEYGMNQNSVKTIGINDQPRKDSYLVYVNQVDGLKGILNMDFD